MSANVKYCPECAKNKNSFGTENKKDFYAGYTIYSLQEKLSDICPLCGEKTLQETNITADELITIGKASNYNPALRMPMRELKDKDIIEYEMKMSQFRAAAATIEENELAHSESKTVIIPICPKCGSTSITTGARGVNGIFGFIGASKTVNRCASCGYTWTPKG